MEKETKSRKQQNPATRKPQDITQRKDTIAPDEITDTPGNIDPVVYGDRLRFFRQQANLTLKTLAAELGIDLSLLSRYEKGKFIIPVAVVVHLHEHHKMSFDWFFFGTGRRTVDAVQDKSNFNDVANMQANFMMLQAKVADMQKQIFKLADENSGLKDQINQVKVKLNF